MASMLWGLTAGGSGAGSTAAHMMVAQSSQAAMVADLRMARRTGSRIANLSRQGMALCYWDLVRMVWITLPRARKASSSDGFWT